MPQESLVIGPHQNRKRLCCHSKPRETVAAARDNGFTGRVAQPFPLIAELFSLVGGGPEVFENVTVVGGPLILSPSTEVDEAEAQLGIHFPTGYREYVTRFGEGVLGGSYLRIYPPRRILTGSNNLAEWRQRINEYWFWDDGRDVLTKQQAIESVIIGDTLDGDELIVHPSNPELVYVLPRNSENIYIAGNGLSAVIEWLCGSGTLTEAFLERNFEPFDSRQ
jgi:hypothetical protein